MARKGSVTFQVEGTKELRRTLRRAGDKLGDLKDVHGRVGAVVVTKAGPWAPRRSGRLAGSLKVQRSAAFVAVKSKLPYAAPMHWGWPSKRIKPRPFLSAAAVQSQPTWLPLYEAEIKAIVGKIKGA